MALDDGIDRAVAAGEKNKKTAELVHAWCANASIGRAGGVGLVEQETGLPIGHLMVQCDHAAAGGMATWLLEDAAVDFYDRNCVGCQHRKPVSTPSLIDLVNKRDQAVTRQRAEHDASEQARKEALEARKRERQEFHATLTQQERYVVGELDRLDPNPEGDSVQTFSRLPQLARESFTPRVVAYLFGQLEKREGWFTEAGLKVLADLKEDARRLASAAMICIANGDHVDLAMSIILERIDSVDERLIEGALRGMIYLASPPNYMFSMERRYDERLLVAIFASYPEATVSGIDKLLNETDAMAVSDGSRALVVLAKHKHCRVA